MGEMHMKQALVDLFCNIHVFYTNGMMEYVIFGIYIHGKFNIYMKLDDSCFTHHSQWPKAGTKCLKDMCRENSQHLFVVMVRVQVCLVAISYRKMTECSILSLAQIPPIQPTPWFPCRKQNIKSSIWRYIACTLYQVQNLMIITIQPSWYDFYLRNCYIRYHDAGISS